MKAGWAEASIGDVCDLMTGGTPSKSVPENFDGDVPWLVSGDIHRGHIYYCEGRISELGLNSSNARWLPINSVMIALNGQGKTRGTVAMLRIPATCNQSLVSIMPKEGSGLLPEFLFHNLRARYHELRQMTGDGGNERRGLNMRLLRTINIPLPPLEEQQRIIVLLDQAFEGLDRAKANAEANLESARELFQAAIAEAFNPGDAEQVGWEMRPLGEIATLQRGFDLPKKDRTPGEYPLVTSSGITDTHYQAKVAGPGVATGRSGSIGKVFYIEEPFWPLNTALYVRDFHGNDPRFVFYLYKFVDLQRFASGTGVPTLNRNDVHRERFSVPKSIEEQRRIVARLDTLHGHVARLKRAYSQSRDYVDQLRQSILAKAFAGELT